MTAQEPVIHGGVVSRTQKYLRGVKAELNKVTWPTKRELIAYTGVVFVAVLIVAALIWCTDNILNKVLLQGVLNLTHA